MTEQPRTPKQNKSIHKYFDEVAVELNNQGITLEVLLKNLEVDITPSVIKDIFRKIGEIKFGRTSTKDLTTKEIQECYEEFNRHLAPHGVHVPFPSFENQYPDDYFR
jgi:hypothetical protein